MYRYYFLTIIKKLWAAVTDLIPIIVVVVFFQTVVNAIRTLAKSYISALVVITLLMIFLIGKVRIGLLSMIPNLLPILMMIGAMGIFSIRMDLFSMLVASMLAIYVASLRSLLTVSSPALPEALSNPSQNLHSFADFSA